jgi:beta-lactamase superfamily II metal-dependent hydrolase
LQASVQESREQLEQVIHQWSNVMSTERFLAGIEASAASVSAAERAAVLDRLALARRFLPGSARLLSAWKTPDER